MKHSRLRNTFLLIFTAAGLTGCVSSFNVKHAHTYDITWSYDGNNHFHKATCEHTNEKKDISAHIYGEWINQSWATETTYGIKERTCSVCGYKDITKIDPHAHQYGDWIVDENATTEKTGTRHRICNMCGYREDETIEILATGVSFNVSDYYDGYYSSIVSWTNGEDLKNQLHDLIRTGFTGLVYEGNWETNQIAEQSLTNFEKVNVVYSQKDDEKVNTYGSGVAGAAGWQREHALCASLMTAYNTGEAVGIKDNGTGRATDFHNLFAAYGAANGARGNKNLGVYNPKNEVTSKAVDADTHADNLNYEPNDCDKGRLARAIFYMGVMYNEDEDSALSLKFNYKDKEGGSHSKSVTVNAKYKPIQIVEDYVEYSQITFTNFVSSTDEDVQTMRDKYLSTYKEDTSAYVYTPNKTESAEEKAESANVLSDFANAYSDYRYNEGNFAIGNLSTLLSWNSVEVDRQEMWHNEVVYSYVHQNDGANKGKKQGNRNPFVDYPELVDYVYGSKKDEPGTMAYLVPSESILDTNSNEPYNYALTSHVNKFIVGETLTSADYSFVRVNKDFTTQEADFEDTNASYTFLESDIGSKTITLTTPTGIVSYDVIVESANGVNACNYNFMLTKDSFSNTKIQTTPSAMLSYEGISYNVSTGVSDCPVAKKDTYAQIGNGTSKPAGTLTIESTTNFVFNEMSNICAVYIGLNTASGCTYNYKISIGGEEVISGTFAYDKNGPQIYGLDLNEPKNGSLKIELTNCTKAVYLSQISVKVN